LGDVQAILFRQIRQIQHLIRWNLGYQGQQHGRSGNLP
jgi:hypothetical protein